MLLYTYGTALMETARPPVERNASFYARCSLIMSQLERIEHQLRVIEECLNKIHVRLFQIEVALLSLEHKLTGRNSGISEQAKTLRKTLDTTIKTIAKGENFKNEENVLDALKLLPTSPTLLPALTLLPAPAPTFPPVFARPPAPPAMNLIAALQKAAEAMPSAVTPLDEQLENIWKDYAAKIRPIGPYGQKTLNDIQYGWSSLHKNQMEILARAYLWTHYGNNSQIGEIGRSTINDLWEKFSKTYQGSVGIYGSTKSEIVSVVDFAATSSWFPADFIERLPPNFSLDDLNAATKDARAGTPSHQLMKCIFKFALEDLQKFTEGPQEPISYGGSTFACTDDIENNPLPKTGAIVGNPHLEGPAEEYKKRLNTLLTLYKIYLVGDEVLKDLNKYDWPRDLNKAAHTTFFNKRKEDGRFVGSWLFLQETGSALHLGKTPQDIIKCKNNELKDFFPEDEVQFLQEKGLSIRTHLGPTEREKVAEIFDYPFRFAHAFLTLKQRDEMPPKFFPAFNSVSCSNLRFFDLMELCDEVSRPLEISSIINNFINDMSDADEFNKLKLTPATDQLWLRLQQQGIPQGFDVTQKITRPIKKDDVKTTLEISCFND